MPLTIVMYHYVRDLRHTRYPRVKGLATERFDGQLDYICKHYNVCSLADVLAASRGGEPLPARPCVLTFDDGFIDHYLTVFPRLRARGLVGGFFPPARPILERCVLDVHKIHFILNCVDDYPALVREIMELLRPMRSQYPQIETDDVLYGRYAIASRFDPAEVIFIKRILQKGLPDPARQALTDELFRRHVDVDEPTLAAELYMDVHQLRCMAGDGMEIGGHGWDHAWLDAQSEADQTSEIRRTHEFVSMVHGQRAQDWTMCYPCGGYSETTLDLLKRHGCALGLTTRVGLVGELARPLELERLDTNDLPCSADAPVCAWTLRACGKPS